ncbi:xylose isomerase, partial [Vibrio crassostreae ZF-91]
ALSLERAADMIENDILSNKIAQRYAGWNDLLGKKIMSGDHSLESLALHATEINLSPIKESGRQERLENIVNSFIYK